MEKLRWNCDFVVFIFFYSGYGTEAEPGRGFSTRRFIHVIFSFRFLYSVRFFFILLFVAVLNLLLFCCRHSRFGGTFVVKGVKSISDNDLVVHSLNNQITSSFDTKKVIFLAFWQFFSLFSPRSQSEALYVQVAEECAVDGVGEKLPKNVVRRF